MSKITPSGLFLKKSPVFESLFVAVSVLFFTLLVWFVVFVVGIVLPSCLHLQRYENCAEKATVLSVFVGADFRWHYTNNRVQPKGLSR